MTTGRINQVALCIIIIMVYVSLLGHSAAAGSFDNSR